MKDNVNHLPSPLEGKQFRFFVRLVVNGLQQGLATICHVLLVRLAFDRLVKTKHPVSLSLMLWVGSGLLAGAVWIAWLRKAERVDAEGMGQTYAHQIRKILFERLSTLAPRALQRRSRGGAMLRFVGDLDALRNWVSLGLARVTVAGVTTVGALLALSIVDWVLALAVALILMLGLWIAITLRKPLVEAIQEARHRRSSLAANIYEKIGATAVVQVFGQFNPERRRMSRQSRRLKEAMVTQAKVIGRLRANTEITTAVASGVVLLLGAMEVASGRTTPGTVVAAMTIVGLLLRGLRDLGQVYEYWYGAQVSRRKIKEFLDTPSLVTEVANAPDLKPATGRLEFRGVSVPGWAGRVTAAAEPGRVVAIVGPNGAGKSTLLLLAARLIDPEEGSILLDGQNLAMHNLASVRRAIGMVGPDLPLLRGTVHRNLCYRWPDAPADEVARVKNLCDLAKVLAELPDGEQTNLIEGGSNLSLGQRQRLMLARALLGNPSILLLDEPDANLDPEGSDILDRILAEYRGTVLAVTNRPQRVAAADVIWYLESGRLMKVGTPAEMLQKMRTYSPPSSHRHAREDVGSDVW